MDDDIPNKHPSKPAKVHLLGNDDIEVKPNQRS
jgi:hypothetical protein